MFVRVLLTVSLLDITTGLVCLYCSDVVAPADCDTVIKCGSHERCYVDAYVSATGSIRYNLGCRDSRQCSGPSHLGKRDLNHVFPSQQLTNKLGLDAGTHEELYQSINSRFSNSKSLLLNEVARDVPNARAGGFLVCSECCTGNLCSNAGCGNKGPVCYQCAEQISQDDCSKIRLCGRDEVCLLQKILNPITHEVRYTTRCEGEQRCIGEILRYERLASVLVGKRQKSSKRESLEIGGSCIVQCCKTDMCNVDCNGTSSSSTSSPVPGSSTPTLATKTVPSSTTVSVHKTNPTTAMSNVPIRTTTTAHRTPQPARITSVYATPPPPTTTGSWVQFTPSTLSMSTTLSSTNSANSCFYKNKFYKQGDVWQDGCRYNCTCFDARTGVYQCQDFCPTYTNLPFGCTLEKIPGQCCSIPNCGTQGGCWYKNMIHREGEHWNDGCDFSCTCMDARTGRYDCKPLCLQWNLPPYCMLYPPPPGKCCSVPVCTGGFTVQYPSGYSQQ